MLVLMSAGICTFYICKTKQVRMIMGHLSIGQYGYISKNNNTALSKPTVYEHSAESFGNIYIIITTILYGGCCHLSL